MNKKECYRLWADENSIWSAWVRPVPFFYCDQNSSFLHSSIKNLQEIEYKDILKEDMAIIVDLPSLDSLAKGLALMKYNYIPIPVYNGTDSSDDAASTMDNRAIANGLLSCSELRASLPLSNHARPAFLLDSDRLHSPQYSRDIFDNSWDIYHQDLPTASFLLSHGISSILLDSKTMGRDLKKILRVYRHQKIKIYQFKNNHLIRRVFF